MVSFASFARLRFCRLLLHLGSLIASPFLSQMPNMRIFFLLSGTIVLQPKKSVEKGYVWLGGLVRAGVWSQQYRSSDGRVPEDVHPSTCPPLHSVGSEWICATCPHSQTGRLAAVNHWINDQYAYWAELDISVSSWSNKEVFGVSCQEWGQGITLGIDS